MVFQFIVDSILDLILFVVNLIPEASACVLDGVDQAIGWFAYIYSASMYIVPWNDIFFMLGITLTIAIGQIAVQSIAYLRR